MSYDLVVIGTGPGGYHAAIRAAQLGIKVLAVEKGEVGGVCLNVGCIPTKALLHVAHTLKASEKAAEFGLVLEKKALDLEKLAGWRDKVVKKLTGGVEFLFKGNGVALKRGEARLVGAREVEVAGERIAAKKIILATGSRPAELKGFPVDEEKIVSSTGALKVEAGVPKRFLAIGGGAIGLEFAAIYKALGAEEVTVLEYMDQILPGADAEAAGFLARALKKQGIKLIIGAEALGYEETEEGLRVHYRLRKNGEEKTLVVDQVLVAVGRRPNSEHLGLEAAGLETDAKGFVPSNAQMLTKVPGIYSIGDLRGAPLLAHKAMKEGVVAAEVAAGKKSAFDQQIPSVVYTFPEFASVGMSEETAKEKGLAVQTGRFPFTANGRALTLQEAEGMVKVVVEAESGVVLGVHAVGPQAGELIAEATLALEMGALVDDLELSIHPHPTLSESLMEAAANVKKAAIHILNK